MRVLKLSVSLFTALICTTCASSVCSGYDGFRHQKTANSLPPGAPLPDIVIEPGDDIEPRQAYKKAIECLRQNIGGDATEYFERAIAALRRTNGHYNKSLAREIVLDYGILLRAHLGSPKASELEHEFGVSADGVARNEEVVFQTFSIKRPVQRPAKAAKRKPYRLQVIQSHDFSKDTKVYLLCKPNGRNIVAVLKVLFAAPTLNPEHLNFDYGPIPPLWQMSISIADALWGTKSYEAKSSEQTEVERTYELRSTQMNGKTISKTKFFLDAFFFNNRLKKYRIRSEGVNTDWQTVPGH